MRPWLPNSLRVLEVDPDRQLIEVYPDPRERCQVFRDMYSCEYDTAPFVMYRVKRNLIQIL